MYTLVVCVMRFRIERRITNDISSNEDKQPVYDVSVSADLKVKLPTVLTRCRSVAVVVTSRPTEFLPAEVLSQVLRRKDGVGNNNCY
jgi:hypothetical protein